MLPLSTQQCPTCSCPATPEDIPGSAGHGDGVPVWGRGAWLCPGRVHAPCEEHTGVHDGSAQHGHCGVLCLQLVLPEPREADSEVLPLVEHCREVEVRRACIVAETAGGGLSEGDTHLSLGGGWTVQRR